jgi:hypothetical protein
MDVIPTSKLVIALIAFGFVFFFLNLAVNAIIQMLDLGNAGIYMVAAIWLFTNLPVVVVLGSALRYLMVQQKRVGYR